MATAPRIALDSTGPAAVDGRHIREVTFRSVRLEYLDQVCWELSLRPAGSRALVVGSGRGLLARELARRGYDVVAADPSPAATALAREADDGAGLTREADDGPDPSREADDGPALTYLTAPAEDLGMPDGSFDLVYVADTFEITPDLDAVTAEAARVLRPGGALVYDTVNRTPVSRLIYLSAFQALPATRIMPRGRYAARRLRTPQEMAASLDRAGLAARDVCGFKPADVRSLVTATRARRRGELTDEQLPGVVRMELAPEGRPVVTYLGYAVRRAVN
ncbi:methyltransferase domain-containing protein [Streptomyces sp. NPDC051940]|uniref:class I SAM-dependent methyltransferase n=1 Tax=Streptomyces sp. NPDC051940 TaxID=3155675 RepID=UPI003428B704